MARIELQDVHLSFRSFAKQRTTFKEFFLHRIFSKEKRAETLGEVKALNGISFTVNKGERLGIVGHNGAGKSTLLRLLAGIYTPSKGRILVQGRVCSMLELGVGIEPDANGWDNIAYRSYLQGQTPKQVREKEKKIAEFSELGPFMDMPVRYYSSGMMVRLVFSIATEIEPEVLVVDEIFSAGDLAFQDKARRRMMNVIDKASILIMASHDLVTLTELCDRVIWLDHGRIRDVGPADEITAKYQEHMQIAAERAAAA